MLPERRPQYIAWVVYTHEKVVQMAGSVRCKGRRVRQLTIARGRLTGQW